MWIGHHKEIQKELILRNQLINISYRALTNTTKSLLSVISIVHISTPDDNLLPPYVKTSDSTNTILYFDPVQRIKRIQVGKPAVGKMPSTAKTSETEVNFLTSMKTAYHISSYTTPTRNFSSWLAGSN